MCKNNALICHYGLLCVISFPKKKSFLSLDYKVITLGSNEG